MFRVLILLGGAASLDAADLGAQQPPARVLEFDFPAMRVGVAEDEAGPTGTTVFYFPNGVTAAADVRGGSPGTVNVPAVSLGYEAAFIDAVVFSGGSWYGLAAATGVADGIKELKRQAGEHDHVAGVLGAIIFDVGGRRFSRVTPDDDLGRAALRAATPNRFPQGPQGAGRFAMQGWYFAAPGAPDSYPAWSHSGQGGAFGEAGRTKVAVFTVVNALGTVVDRSGSVVRCHRNDAAASCPSIAGLVRERMDGIGAAIPTDGGATSNTTLTLVVTNQKLSFAQLQRLAVQVHGSMARAIQPFATEEDGDVLYAVTTNEVENDQLSAVDLGLLASELAWDAVLNSVPPLPEPPRPRATAPAPAELETLVGEYETPGGDSLVVRRDGNELSITYSGSRSVYLATGRRYVLIPADADHFIVDSAARDVIRFDSQGGRIAGLTLNPGAWGVSAQRMR